MVVIDKEHKEMKEEQKEEAEQKKVTWFQKVPAFWKLAGIALIFVKYLEISNKKGNLGELWIWVIGVLIVWYFLGAEIKRENTGLLTPAEADKALRLDIERKIKEGQISRFARIYIGPHNGLFMYEGMPKHYIIGVKIIEENYKQYKRAIVVAEGPARGFVTLQGVPNEVQGSEVIPVATPKVFKTLKKYDVDLERFMWGYGKK